MTRIANKFADLKSQGKSAFVSYIMAGDPDYDTTTPYGLCRWFM